MPWFPPHGPADAHRMQMSPPAMAMRFTTCPICGDRSRLVVEREGLLESTCWVCSDSSQRRVGTMVVESGRPPAAQRA